MRQSVRSAFFDFTAKFEGVVAWPYCDVLGLVTVGVGNLIDPIDAAIGLPWIHESDGSTVAGYELIEAWNRVKNDKSLAKLGHLAARHVTDIRLTAEGITELVHGKLDSNWEHLLRRFPNMEEWPADGQLMVASVAWAAGPDWKAPLFDGFARDMDFRGMAKQCWLNDANNPGLHPRNLANVKLATNAAQVIENDMDRGRLWYPVEVLPEVTC